MSGLSFGLICMKGVKKEIKTNLLKVNISVNEEFFYNFFLYGIKFLTNLTTYRTTAYINIKEKILPNLYLPLNSPLRKFLFHVWPLATLPHNKVVRYSNF